MRLYNTIINAKITIGIGHSSKKRLFINTPIFKEPEKNCKGHKMKCSTLTTQISKHIIEFIGDKTQFSNEWENNNKEAIIKIYNTLHNSGKIYYTQQEASWNFSNLSCISRTWYFKIRSSVTNTINNIEIKLLQKMNRSFSWE